ncbi:major facilitator superfamily transporter [Colletotrichum truncatum]|uniref:Major facilitator superfamily transporter n=1 Tax=Colletotrichum truncatum TaxID=5467 RepID=A0ACC3YSV3_COLTU|nr:major facilitator superfamily transporter [Colletotrichum truncatum]KAF6785147.1 major facilitator superfamily transporter [Colletotrichum truncatum]
MVAQDRRRSSNGGNQPQRRRSPDNRSDSRSLTGRVGRDGRSSRIYIDEEEDSDKDTEEMPELVEKVSYSSFYLEKDNENDKILPASLTDDWEEKIGRLSRAETLAERSSRGSGTVVVVGPNVRTPPRRRRCSPGAESSSSSSSGCSNCGHGGRSKLANGMEAPVIPSRMSSLQRRSPTGRKSQLRRKSPIQRKSSLQRKTSFQRHGSLRLTPRIQPMSPTEVAVSERIAYPMSLKTVSSHSISEIHVRHSPPRVGKFSDIHSDTASMISSFFTPELRHLASQSSLRSSRAILVNPEPASTPITEQRHPGKAGAKISRFTRPYEPDIAEEDAEDCTRQVRRSEALKVQQRISVVLAAEESEEGQWTRGLSLVLLMVGICIAVFLISIDRTILSTAIPYITAEFQSTADIGWYGSAYLLTACAFQPVFGRVFTLFSIKWSYLLAIFIFVIGSLICAVAPNSTVLIVGCAVAGFASAGILTGSFVVVATAAPPKLRPIYTAVVGLVFGLGATVGPLLGGVFTDLVTWRWCFYMNIPLALVTMALFLLFFHHKQSTRSSQTIGDRILDLDLVGNVFLLSACVLLFLALEYASEGEAWSSKKIIGLLSGAGATTVVFAAWQWWKQDSALIPPAIITQRTVAASCVAAFATYGAMLIHSYFLPIWFQAIRGDDAISSGVDMIPYMATMAFFSLLAGIFVTVWGYFVPPAIIGGLVGTAGCALLLLLTPDTPASHLMGFEILVAAGLGMATQQGFTAVQTVLPEEEVPIAIAAVVASQSLGGAIFISVGNTLFQSRFMQASMTNMVSGVNMRMVLETGATAFRTAVPDSALPQILDLYNDALKATFTAAIPLAALAAIAACFMEWKSVKGKKTL